MAGSEVGAGTSAPVDALLERLNDPGVAAALVTLLDNTDLLSTLVLGLSGFVERSESIVDSVASSVAEFKASGTQLRPEGIPTLAELGATAGQLTASVPALSRVLESSMVKPQTIDALSVLSDALAEGAQNARSKNTRIDGVRGILRTLKDPEIQRGLGMLVEVARALGRRM
jgi:hypothetical protein